MSDLSFQLLSRVINQASKDNGGNRRGLWVVDENVSDYDISQIRPSEHLMCVTNRYDICRQLLDRGFNVQLNDFDFSFLGDDRLQTIYYRVSKEKALVHHVINQSLHYLCDDGELYLAGYKQEGIKTYVDKALVLLGAMVSKERGGKTSLLTHIRKTISNGIPLDDKNYPSLRLLNKTLKIKTKPGIFGWNKVDKGSEFLIDNIESFLAGLSSYPKTILDLGCGYGYIAIMANHCLAARYVATDNNITAVSACEKNFKSLGVQGEVVLDDCAAGIHQSFDIILCNPPFHQGFGVEKDLTDKFLSSSRRLLKENGRCLFVVNSFIPLERKAEAYFSDVKIFASNRSFKLISLGA